jgi:hypothetical protein
MRFPRPQRRSCRATHPVCENALDAQTIITRPGLSRPIEPDRLDAIRCESIADYDEHFCRVIRACRRGIPPSAIPLAWSTIRGTRIHVGGSQRHISLEEARLTAVEQRIEAELAPGRHAKLIQLLPTLVIQNPELNTLEAANHNGVTPGPASPPTATPPSRRP